MQRQFFVLLEQETIPINMRKHKIYTVKLKTPETMNDQESNILIIHPIRSVAHNAYPPNTHKINTSRELKNIIYNRFISELLIHPSNSS